MSVAIPIQTVFDPRQLRPELWTVVVPLITGKTKYVQFASSQDAQSDVFAHGYGSVQAPKSNPNANTWTVPNKPAPTAPSTVTGPAAVRPRRWNAEIREVAQDLSDAARDQGLAAFMEFVPTNADF